MLKPEAFERGLYHHHDTEFVKYIVDSCRYGVDTGYECVRQHLIRANWPSSTDCADPVHK